MEWNGWEAMLGRRKGGMWEGQKEGCVMVGRVGAYKESTFGKERGVGGWEVVPMNMLTEPQASWCLKCSSQSEIPGRWRMYRYLHCSERVVQPGGFTSQYSPGRSGLHLHAASKQSRTESQ